MELREVIVRVERALDEPLSPRAPSSQPLVPVSQPLASDGEGPEEAGVNHDPADAPLALRSRESSAYTPCAGYTRAWTQALDVVERLARRANARLPERDRAGATRGVARANRQASAQTHHAPSNESREQRPLPAGMRRGIRALTPRRRAGIRREPSHRSRSRPRSRWSRRTTGAPCMRSKRMRDRRRRTSLSCRASSI